MNPAEDAAAELAEATTPDARRAAAARLAVALTDVWHDVARDCSGWLRTGQITLEDIQSDAGKNISLLADRIVSGKAPHCTPCHYVWYATKRDANHKAKRAEKVRTVSLDAMLDGGSR